MTSDWFTSLSTNKSKSNPKFIILPSLIKT